jgi:hypothetical protein
MTGWTELTDSLWDDGELEIFRVPRSNVSAKWHDQAWYGRRRHPQQAIVNIEGRSWRMEFNNLGVPINQYNVLEVGNEFHERLDTWRTTLPEG